MALDLDALAGRIGGWREDFSTALELARGRERALVVRHLRSGHDVARSDLVERIRRHLGEYLARRPPTIRVATPGSGRVVPG